MKNPGGIVVSRGVTVRISVFGVATGVAALSGKGCRRVKSWYSGGYAEPCVVVAAGFAVMRNGPEAGGGHTCWNTITYAKPPFPTFFRETIGSSWRPYGVADTPR